MAQTYFPHATESAIRRHQRQRRSRKHFRARDADRRVQYALTRWRPESPRYDDLRERAGVRPG